MSYSNAASGRPPLTPYDLQRGGELAVDVAKPTGCRCAPRIWAAWSKFAIVAAAKPPAAPELASIIHLDPSPEGGRLRLLADDADADWVLVVSAGHAPGCPGAPATAAGVVPIVVRTDGHVDMVLIVLPHDAALALTL